MKGLRGLYNVGFSIGVLGFRVVSAGKGYLPQSCRTDEHASGEMGLELE